MQTLCPSCGERIPAHALVCPECGQGVRHTEARIDPLKVIDKLDLEAGAAEQGGLSMQGFNLTSLDIADDFEIIEPPKKSGEAAPVDAGELEPPVVKAPQEAESTPPKSGLAAIPAIDEVPAAETPEAPVDAPVETPIDAPIEQEESSPFADEADSAPPEPKKERFDGQGEISEAYLFDPEILGAANPQQEASSVERDPLAEPVVEAAVEPVAAPAAKPTAKPVAGPAVEPIAEPAARPIEKPDRSPLFEDEPLQRTSVMPPVRESDTPLVAPPADPRSERPNRGRVPSGPSRILILLVTGLIALGLVVVGWFSCTHNAAGADEHRVTFALHAPGYNGQASSLPVQVKGTSNAGREIDKLVFLDSGGNGVILPAGNFTLTFPGGSFLASGTVLRAPEDYALEIEVPEGLAKNEFYQVSLENVVTYEAITPLNATDEIIEQVYTYASQNPSERTKVDELRDNAKAKHEEAVAKNNEDSEALLKKASRPITAVTGDNVDFVGTIRILTAEELGEALGDENIMWNFAERSVAILWLDEMREVTMEPDAGGYNYSESGDPIADEYEVSQLLLNTDITGVYGEPDDGTLAAFDGKHVLVSGKITRTADWASSQIAPVSVLNPEIEEL